MAKFTIYFKDKITKSYIFDTGVIHIGRDDFNDMVIDNIDVAPAHAIIIIKADNYIIRQLNDAHPLIVNSQETGETILQDNDVITVGKHSIVFNDYESTDTSTIEDEDEDENNDESFDFLKETKNITNLPNANLQVLDGQHIGRILPLRKSMTRFGHDGTGVVIISKRKEGYFISSLESDANIQVNREPLTDKTIHLNNNDIVLINNISMQFFMDP